jgi:outer membrane protein OmpA-like peptidoglycan-associated protein
MRYTTTIATVAILAFATQTASAAASREENIGVGSGAIVGAIAGGPVGFIIGAAIGAKLGDTMHSKAERIDSLQGTLQNSQQSAAELQRGIDELNTEVEHLQNTARPELISLMQAGIDMDLLFRTDEFALTDTTGDRLSQMAATLASMQDVRIQLDGFADERGDADYNHVLSEKRVEFVRTLFIAAGVHPLRISTSAHGESVAQNPDVDSYALERRVSVKLFIDNTESVALNPR